MFFDIMLKGDTDGYVVTHQPVLSPLPIKPFKLKLQCRCYFRYVRSMWYTLICNLICNYINKQLIYKHGRMPADKYICKLHGCLL